VEEHAEETVAIARARITAQGQISVPAEVRKELGVGPGSFIEFAKVDDQIVVRKVGKYTWSDVHKAAFPEGPPKPRSLEELKEGIRAYIRKKHARR
jgi:AbrB family looped-hinge helix DNA binding protein